LQVGKGEKVVATATTDKTGTFSVKIKPGSYYMVAGNDNIGWIYEGVDVKAGEDKKFGNIKLSKP
ncbi:MAG: hypothetical protein ACREJC_05690, partial [Tepidisphaeraceae bacterium]